MYQAPRPYVYPLIPAPYFNPHYAHYYAPPIPYHNASVKYGFRSDASVPELTDYGKQPFVINIERASKQNQNYRTALWTGKYLQVTLMSLNVGEDIGLEIHPHTDQFLRIEEGEGIVQMGKSKDRLDFEKKVSDDDAIMIPAGTWHNVTNTGNTPMKLYSIYAPPEHPFGTVHPTKAEAMASEAVAESAL